MGVCGSKEQGGCVRVGLGNRKKNKHDADRAAAADGETIPRLPANHGRRRRRLGRKKTNNNTTTNRYSSRSKVDPSADAVHPNPTFNGNNPKTNSYCEIFLY